MSNRSDRCSGKHRGFRTSIFLKILIVLFFTGVTIHFSIITYHHTFQDFRHKGALERNLENYIEYVIKDLGIPPDKNRAIKLKENYSFDIRYESLEDSWATSDDIPSTKEINKERNGHRHPRIGGGKGRLYYIAEKDHGTYTFATDFRRFFEPGKLYFAGIIVLLTIILTVSYMVIRWIFKPIKWLDEGVAEIGKGNLEYRIPIKNRRDELGELSISFNEMAKRIKEMIQAKEQLLLDVSHELRSPITRIRVALEFISKSKEKESILEDVAELETKITELLESEKLNSDHGKLNLEVFDLADIVRKTIQGFEKQTTSIKISTELEELKTEADIERIKVVLKNVIENAIKYSSSDSQPIKIVGRKEEEFILLTIEDHGVGIHQEDLPNIFEPFYRTDKSRSRNTGGYGLGMSLCKKIIDAHGGSIEIRSTYGEGTTVMIKLRQSGENKL